MDERNVIIYLLIGLILFVVFAFGVIYFLNYSQRKITQGELDARKKEIEYQQKLLTNTIETQEEERSRIAKELHDDISSKLNIALMNIRYLRSNIDGEEDQSMVIDNIESAISLSSQRARGISHDLIPPMIEKFGLGYAINDLSDSINLNGDFTFLTKGLDDLQISNDKKVIHIFRIIQELTQNTMKYAKASTVNLGFVQEGQKLIISYKDNGDGFEMEEVQKGIGFENIQSRIKVINGELELNSSPGNGMQATIKLDNHV